MREPEVINTAGMLLHAGLLFIGRRFKFVFPAPFLGARVLGRVVYEITAIPSEHGDVFACDFRKAGGSKLRSLASAQVIALESIEPPSDKGKP